MTIRARGGARQTNVCASEGMESIWIKQTPGVSDSADHLRNARERQNMSDPTSLTNSSPAEPSTGPRRRTKLAPSSTQAAALVPLRRRWSATNIVARVDGVHVVAGDATLSRFSSDVRIHHLISFPRRIWAKTLDPVPALVVARVRYRCHPVDPRWAWCQEQGCRNDPGQAEGRVPALY